MWCEGSRVKGFNITKKDELAIKYRTEEIFNSLD